MIRFESFTRTEIADGESRTIPLDDVQRWLALANYNIYWIAPHTGTNPSDIPAQTQYLLWQKSDNSFGVALPMISGDVKAALRGSEDGIVVTMQGALPGTEPEEAVLLCIAEGDDPYALSREAVAAVAAKLGSFRLRTEKKTPAFMERLGWCTWDAFYGAVDEAKVLSGLDSFRENHFPLGFMILDDGAWDNRGDWLYEAQINPVKFPDGLSKLIRCTKEEYGLKHFGVWHNFEGYWAGICPESPLSARYTLLDNRGNIRPWTAEPTESELHFICPEEIGRFYNELHGYLLEQGVDMVKIDGQGAMDAMTRGVTGQGRAMQAYQQAMQTAASRCFDAQVIHCMCNSVDVAYNIRDTNCWRNSDDYIPGNLRKQQEHLYINAMNAMWSSNFAVPDWDMFQSHAPGAEIHAAARAISGGPVYVSDKPGQQDFAILRRLVTGDGRLLRCDGPALPAPDCLFTDCRREKTLLKVFNFCGKAGVLGAFNCTEEDAVSGALRAADIPGLAGERFAVYLQPAGRVLTVGWEEAIPVTLGKGEYALALFVPIEKGVAPLGLLDKYNTAAAVIRSQWQNERLCVELLDAGEIGVYCEKALQRVLCNGAEASCAYDPASGLLRIHAREAGKTTVEIML